MFGRKKKAEETLWANLIDPPTKETYMPQSEDNALYTVGTLDDGRVQLRVGHPTTVVLTMNNAGVRQMIKLLEAAMIEEEENTNG